MLKVSSALLGSMLAGSMLAGCGTEDQSSIDLVGEDIGVAVSPLHAWGTYHWARTANPFTLKTVDSVTSGWDAYLDGAIADWSVSDVLDLAKESGNTSSTDRKKCAPITGKIRACNQNYGGQNWSGLAQIWLNATGHIVQGTTKVNEFYFNGGSYDTPAKRRMVMCQEIAHDFGLDHQDEDPTNVNLGSCMDYTNDPDGGPGGASETDPSNEHPNAHDYEEIAIIYTHTDSTSSVASALTVTSEVDRERLQVRGRPRLFRKELPDGEVMLTWVFWADEMGLTGILQ